MNTTTSNVRVNITRTTNLKYLLHDHKPVPVHEARKAWAQFRQAHGLKYTTPPLLSEPSANLKLDKTQAYGHNSFVASGPHHAYHLGLLFF